MGIMRFNLVQSKHNIDSNRYLVKANPDYPDWEITTLFYSAIHIVNAYLFLAVSKVPKSHYKRKELIKLELNSIYRDYCSLETLSQKARYRSSYQDITPEVDKAKRCHAEIFTFVKKRLQEFDDDVAQLLRDDDSLENMR